MDTPSPLNVLRTLLQQCHAEGLPLVQIRHRALSESEAYSGGDYDFLMRPGDKPRLLQMLFALCSTHALPFLVDQRKREKTVLRLYEAQSGREIILDIWERLELRRPGEKTMDYLLWEQFGHHISDSDDGYRLNSRFEALYYLCHLHTKRKALHSETVQQRLHEYREQQRDDPALMALFDALPNDGIDSVATRAVALLETLLRPAPDHSARRLRLGDRLYKTRMRYLARGNILAFAGPDGVGKGTIISEYKQLLAGRVKYYRFKKLFRNALLYKLLLPLLRRAAEKRHHSKLEKNQVDDEFGGVLFAIARLRFPAIALRRLWGTLLLSDRYFHDFLCRGLRFGDESPRLRRGQPLLRRLIPAPRCLVQLDAANAVIAARKAELSDEAVDLYRATVFASVVDHPPPYYLYLNTGLPLEHCLTTLKSAGKPLGLELYDFQQTRATELGSDAIDLGDAKTLGAGHERTCYIDPRDNSRCIKVSRYQSGDRAQNRVEHDYLQALLRRGVRIDFMPACHGWVATSEGRGLVFDRITTAEGGPAPTLGQALQQGLLSCSEAAPLLQELYDYFQANAIVFADICLDNILVGASAGGGPRLYVVDGLGARRYGMKLWLRSRFTPLARRKLKKQWPELRRKVQALCPP